MNRDDHDDAPVDASLRLQLRGLRRDVAGRGGEIDRVAPVRDEAPRRSLHLERESRALQELSCLTPHLGNATDGE